MLSAYATNYNQETGHGQKRLKKSLVLKYTLSWLFFEKTNYFPNFKPNHFFKVLGTTIVFI